MVNLAAGMPAAAVAGGGACWGSVVASIETLAAPVQRYQAPVMLWCTCSSMFQGCSGEVYIVLPGLLPSSRLPNSDKKWGQRRAAQRPPHPAHFTPPRAIAPWTSPVYHASSSFQYTFTQRPTAA